MDCFGTYFTTRFVVVVVVVVVLGCVNVLCSCTHVIDATEWTASGHTLHMSKPNVTRVQSATAWTASVHTSHMSKPNLVFKVLRNGLLWYILYTCPNLM